MRQGGGERCHEVTAQVPQRLDVVRVADPAGHVGELLGAGLAEQREHGFADVLGLVLEDGIAGDPLVAHEAINTVTYAFEPTHLDLSSPLWGICLP